MALLRRGALWVLALICTNALAVVPQIASSDTHTLVVKADGSVWAWGSNTRGVLGDGTTTDRPSPVLIGEGFASVTSGRLSSYAIRSDGTLWGWGANDQGQLGDGGIGDRHVPVMIGSDFQVVSANWSMAVGVKSDGSLWSWGAAAYGALGDGRMEAHIATKPQLIGRGFRTAHTSMNHVLAIKTDGTLWAWGVNDAGQLGTGDFDSRAVPTQVDSGFVAISAGESFSLGIKDDGTLWGWGLNTLGELGLGTPGTITDPAPNPRDQYRTRPVRLSGQGYAAVTNGSFHSHALTGDGVLWGWGLGSYGALGDGLTDSSDGTPHVVVTPKKIGEGYWLTTRGGGNNNGFAIKTDGSVWAWGTNAGGQLGDGTQQDRLTPTPIGVNVLPSVSLVTSAGTSGPIEARTLRASIAPKQVDAGRQGCIFVGAALADAGMVTLAAKGWGAHRNDQPQAYFCGPLLAYEDTLLRALDVRQYLGTNLYIGYGVGETPASSFADMLQRGLVALTYTVR